MYKISECDYDKHKTVCALQPTFLSWFRSYILHIVRKQKTNQDRWRGMFKHCDLSMIQTKRGKKDCKEFRVADYPAEKFTFTPHLLPTASLAFSTHFCLAQWLGTWSWGCRCVLVCCSSPLGQTGQPLSWQRRRTAVCSVKFRIGECEQARVTSQPPHHQSSFVMKLAF